MEKLILKKDLQTWEGVKELFLKRIPAFVPAGTYTIVRGLDTFIAQNYKSEKIGVISDADFFTLWEAESLIPENELTIPAISDSWEAPWSEE